jgi:hypothetical protein
MARNNPHPERPDSHPYAALRNRAGKLSRFETDFTDNMVIALSLSWCVRRGAIDVMYWPGHSRTLENATTLGPKRQLLGHERTAAK